MKTRSAAFGPLGGVALVWATATCAADAVPNANDADGAATNPIPSTIMGRAEAFELSGGRMRISLTVTGLPPNHLFESRLHKLMCDTDGAGADYQNHPYPRDGSATDPAFSNSTNEA